MPHFLKPCFLLSCSIAVCTAATPALAQVQILKPAIQTPETQGKRDEVVQRVPLDRRVSASMDRVEQLFAEQKNDQAFAVLQTALVRPGTLVRTPDGFETVANRSHRILASLSREQIDQYQARYGPLAKRQLNEALQVNKNAAIADVAMRFFFTKAGFRAANLLATMHLDRGEIAAAYRWMVKLYTANADIAQAVEWQLRFAAVRKVWSESVRRFDMEVVLNGEKTSAQEWLDAIDLSNDRTAPVLENWSQLHGNAARSARASGGDPLLVKRWDISTTDAPGLQQKIQDDTTTILDSKRAALPVGFPVAMNGRIIFRTLRGAVVAHADSGAIQFETRDNNSANSSTGFRGSVRTTSPIASRNGLGAHFYRNGVWGLLACDDQRVYVIERYALFPPQYSPYSRSSRPSQQFKTNQLTAYDLTFGMPVWDVGGPITNESFERSLAGHFFLGPPMVDNDRAYVIAESDGEVRLCVLDTETGQEIWSELLLLADPPIDRDTTRRNWPAQVAASEGILICPTTLGWVVAIEEASRSLVWMKRLPGTKKPESAVRLSRRTPVSEVKKLNERWLPSAPMISGGRVICAPCESGSLVCLRLSDGKQLWERAKSDSDLYVAGIHNKQVIVVSREAVTAYGLTSGKSAWKVELEAFPSGRGVITSDQFYQPIEGSRVVRISFANQKVDRTFRTDSGRDRIGNLVMHRGQVFSQTAHGLTAFEQEQHFEEQLASAENRANSGPALRLQIVRVALIDGEPDKALDELRQIDLKSLSPALQTTHTELERLALTRKLEAANADRANEFLDRIEALAKTPAERFNARRLGFERLYRDGNFAAAGKALLDLYEAFPDNIPFSNPSAAWQQFSDAWLAARFQDLQETADAGTLAEIDAAVVLQIQKLPTQTSAAEQRVFDIFSGFPAVSARLLEAADRAVKAGDFSRAQSFLRTLSALDDPEVAGPAALSLAALLQRAGLGTESRTWYQRCVEQFPNVPLADSGSVGDTAKNALQAFDADFASTASESWNAKSWNWSRLGSSYNIRSATRDLIHGRFRDSITRRFQIEYDQGSGRINFLEAAKGTVYWSLPFPRSSGNVPACEVVNQHVVIAGHNVVKCLSVLDRRILWTVRTDEATTNSVRYTNTGAGIRVNGELVYSGQLLFERAQRSRVVVNRDYVAIRSRNSIQVRDLVTGAKRWQRRLSSSSFAMFGNASSLYCVEGNEKLLAFHPVDGSKSEPKTPRNLAAQAIAMTDQGMLTIDSRSVFFTLGSTTQIRVFDPLTNENENVWDERIDGKIRMTLADRNTLLLATNTGKVRALDTATGRGLFEGRLFANKRPPKIRSLHAVRDGDRIYVVLPGSSSSSFSTQLPLLPISGQLICLDANSGDTLWDYSAEKEQLILEHLGHSPALILHGRNYVVRNNRGYNYSKLVALDKSTGKELAKATSASYSTYQSIHVNPVDRYLEIRAYDRRMRLQAVSPKNAATN